MYQTQSLRSNRVSALIGLGIFLLAAIAAVVRLSSPRGPAPPTAPPRTPPSTQPAGLGAISLATPPPPAHFIAEPIYTSPAHRYELYVTDTVTGARFRFGDDSGHARLSHLNGNNQFRKSCVTLSGPWNGNRPT